MRVSTSIRYLIKMLCYAKMGHDEYFLQRNRIFWKFFIQTLFNQLYSDESVSFNFCLSLNLKIMTGIKFDAGKDNFWSHFRVLKYGLEECPQIRCYGWSKEFWSLSLIVKILLINLINYMFNYHLWFSRYWISSIGRWTALLF